MEKIRWRKQMGEKGYERRKKRRAIFCPECGKQIPVASVYCEHCGKRIWEAGADYAAYGDRAHVAGFSFNRKRLFGAAAVLLLLFAVCGFLPNMLWTAEIKNVFYIKDNSVYGYKSGKQEKRPEEFSAQYLEKWSGRPAGGLLTERKEEYEHDAGLRIPGTAPSYSDSGRYFYYTELGVSDSFNLIRRDQKKKETKTLDSGVLEFLPAQGGRVVYKKENNALYYYDGSRKNKIASDSDFYRVSENGSRLLWMTEENGVRDIYIQELSKKSEPLRLERNAVLLDAAEDLSAILVQKEDSVFKVTAKAKKDKLIGEISASMQGDVEAGSFYFLRDEAEDSAAEDNAAEDNAAVEDISQELYYFSDGKAKLIDDSFKELLWQGDGALLYTRAGTEGCMITWGGKTAELGHELALPGQVQVDNGRLYFLSKEEAPGESGKPERNLCSVLLTEPELQVTVVDRGVSEIACVYGGISYYYKKMGSSMGDLYRDGEWVAFDVSVGSVTGIPGGNTALCIADSSSSGKRGTLTLLSAEGSRNIADNVRAYSAVSEKEIFVLSGFSREKRRGDLLLFDGQKTGLLEADVWGYYGTGNSGICR